MTGPTRKHRARPAVGFNLTPMIDVVFLLICFFMLVSQFASAENVAMDLPQPDISQAVKVKLTDRVVINGVLTTPWSPQTSGVAWSIGPLRVASLSALSNRLAAAKAANPNLRVVLRADRRIPYRSVREVMNVIAENRIEVMYLVAHVGEGPQS
jgi:biopolymer transport protein ExbD